MYNNLNVGNKFYMPVKGNDVEFVTIGKDINPNPEEKDHFIDVMSTSIVLKNVPWVKSIYSYEDLHYIRSDIMKLLEEQKQYLPQEIQDAIIPRKAKFLTERNLITKNCKYDYVDIGSIWLPSLREITGETRESDDCPDNQQYPYFEEHENRKLNGMWWLRSTKAFNDRFVYFMYPNCDFWDCRIAQDWIVGVPLCFRLKI